jgi:hypothetical protein
VVQLRYRAGDTELSQLKKGRQVPSGEGVAERR